MTPRKRYFLKRMFLFYLLAAIPILISASTLYLIIRGNIKTVIEQNALVQLTLSKNNAESILDVSEHVGTVLADSPDLYIAVSSLLSRERIDFSGLQTYRYMVQMIRYPANVNQHIHSIYLYINNKRRRFLSSSGRLETADAFPDKQWLESYLAEQESSTAKFEIRTIPSGAGGLEAVSIYRPISGGVIVTNVDRRVFNTMLESYHNYDGELLLITQDGRLLFSAGDPVMADAAVPLLSAEPGEISVNGTTYIANSEYSERFALHFWSLVPKDTMYSGLSALLRYTGLALTASLVITFVCAYLSTRRSFSRLNRVNDIFNRAKQGFPVESLLPPAQDEYTLLLDNIVKTFLQQSYLKLQLSERQYMQQAAELAALQLQINPHFLFNTLQTIEFEILRECGEDSPASKMLQRLSDLMQYSLQNPGGFVRIGDEMAYLKIYCEIQKFRYEKKFFVSWDTDARLDNYCICRLILQPLVENSFYHGIKLKEGTAFIKVSIREKDGRIAVKVIDTGVGMDKDTVAKINEKLILDDNTPSAHIGLLNTSRRLRLSFGADSRLCVRSKQNFGTIVSFTIPKRL